MDKIVYKEGVITKVVSKPYKKYNRWYVDVDYRLGDKEGELQLSFDTFEQAMNVEIGKRVDIW